jgi:hypothetical protein
MSFPVRSQHPLGRKCHAHYVAGTDGTKSDAAEHAGSSMKPTSFRILLLVFGATCASTRVLADDAPGFYVGGGLGNLMSEPQKKSSEILTMSTGLMSNTAPEADRRNSANLAAGCRVGLPRLRQSKRWECDHEFWQSLAGRGKGLDTFRARLFATARPIPGRI